MNFRLMNFRLLSISTCAALTQTQVWFTKEKIRYRL